MINIGTHIRICGLTIANIIDNIIKHIPMMVHIPKSQDAMLKPSSIKIPRIAMKKTAIIIVKNNAMILFNINSLLLLP